MRYFNYEETPYRPGKWLIKVVHKNLPFNSTLGSYNVLAARLLKLSYPNYLRYCRDNYGAEIIGKNCMYPVAYFEQVKAKNLCEILNRYANFVFNKESEE